MSEEENNQLLLGVCPSCGKPFKVEKEGGEEGKSYCTDVCKNPAAIPTGVRLQADQATYHFIDGNMNEYKRDEYIRVHGVDPLPIWEAVKKWREDQVEKWKM
ncbi:MAG: hypothetical protein ACE14P_07285 [Methanotrichaceae archaeon]